MGAHVAVEVDDTEAGQWHACAQLEGLPCVYMAMGAHPEGLSWRFHLCSHRGPGRLLMQIPCLRGWEEGAGGIQAASFCERESLWGENSVGKSAEVHSSCAGHWFSQQQKLLVCPAQQTTGNHGHPSRW